MAVSAAARSTTPKPVEFARSFGNPGCCGWDTRAPFHLGNTPQGYGGQGRLGVGGTRGKRAGGTPALPGGENIQHRTSNIEHPTSNIQHPTSNIQHPTSNIQQYGATGGGACRTLPPTLMATAERRFLPRRLVSAKQCEDGSFQAKAGPARRVLLTMNFVPCRRPALRGAVQPAILNPPFPILALAVSRQ